MSLANLELAKPEDADSILETIRSLSAWLKTKGVSQWSDAFPRELLQAEMERGELFVLRDRGEPVASVVLSEIADELWDDADRAAVYLSRLAVARSQAGKKTGVAVMKWAEQETRRRGGSILRLACDAKNPFLTGYYRRLGFSHIGVKHYSPYRMDFARFEKQL